MLFSLAIAGPTASGKTALSIALAKELSAELISADSMQIYKGMDVGTAKATKEERETVAHHLLDVISPAESFSVEDYRDMAIAAVRDISARGRLPVFVGGTGLYIDSVSRGAPLDSPESDPEYRERVLASVKTEEDVLALWQRLRECDPESAEKIHKNNIKRVIRALEIYEKTGKPKSLLDKESKKAPSEVFVGLITLDFHDRDTLYARIDRRVDEMMAAGLVSEVESLYRAGLLTDGTASQAIGYKEICDHFRGECTLAEAVERIKLASRRYAKRQLTWFRREEGARTVYVDREDGELRPFDEIVCEALAHYKDFLSQYESNER